MKTDQIKLEFQNEYKGKVITPNGEIKIGRGEDEYAPYHLLYGALGSCYYLTFLALCRKAKTRILIVLRLRLMVKNMKLVLPY